MNRGEDHWGVSRSLPLAQGVRFDLKVLKTAFHDAYV